MCQEQSDCSKVSKFSQTERKQIKINSVCPKLLGEMASRFRCPCALLGHSKNRRYYEVQWNVLCTVRIEHSRKQNHPLSDREKGFSFIKKLKKLSELKQSQLNCMCLEIFMPSFFLLFLFYFVLFLHPDHSPLPPLFPVYPSTPSSHPLFQFLFRIMDTNQL